jgi:hypothetical protein
VTLQAVLGLGVAAASLYGLHQLLAPRLSGWSQALFASRRAAAQEEAARTAALTDALENLAAGQGRLQETLDALASTLQQQQQQQQTMGGCGDSQQTEYLAAQSPALSRHQPRSQQQQQQQQQQQYGNYGNYGNYGSGSSLYGGPPPAGAGISSTAGHASSGAALAGGGGWDPYGAQQQPYDDGHWAPPQHGGRPGSASSARLHGHAGPGAHPGVQFEVSPPAVSSNRAHQPPAKYQQQQQQQQPASGSSAAPAGDPGFARRAGMHAAGEGDGGAGAPGGGGGSIRQDGAPCLWGQRCRPAAQPRFCVCALCTWSALSVALASARAHACAHAAAAALCWCVRAQARATRIASRRLLMPAPTTRRGRWSSTGCVLPGMLAWRAARAASAPRTRCWPCTTCARRHTVLLLQVMMMVQNGITPPNVRVSCLGSCCVAGAMCCSACAHRSRHGVPAAIVSRRRLQGDINDAPPDPSRPLSAPHMQPRSKPWEGPAAAAAAAAAAPSAHGSSTPFTDAQQEPQQQAAGGRVMRESTGSSGRLVADGPGGFGVHAYGSAPPGSGGPPQQQQQHQQLPPATTEVHGMSVGSSSSVRVRASDAASVAKAPAYDLSALLGDEGRAAPWRPPPPPAATVARPASSGSNGSGKADAAANAAAAPAAAAAAAAEPVAHGDGAVHGNGAEEAGVAGARAAAPHAQEADAPQPAPAPAPAAAEAEAEAGAEAEAVGVEAS